MKNMAPSLFQAASLALTINPFISLCFFYVCSGVRAVLQPTTGLFLHKECMLPAPWCGLTRKGEVVFKDTEDGGGSPVPFNVVILFLEQISRSSSQALFQWRIRSQEQFGRVAIAPAAGQTQIPSLGGSPA